MTTTTRDTILRYLVQTSGDKELAALAEEILALGTSSGTAEKELDGLLNTLAQQAKAGKAVDTYARLRKELEQTRTDLVQARAGAAELFKTFDEGDRSSAAVTRQMAAARKAITDLEAAEKRQLVEIQSLRSGLKGLGVDYSQLGNAQAQIAAKTAAASQSVRSLAAGLRDASAAERAQVAALQESLQAQRRLEAANRASAAALEKYRSQAKPAAADTRALGEAASSASGFMSSLRGTLAGLVGALSLRSAIDGAVNILKIGDAAQRTRLQLQNLFGGQAAGNAAFNQLRALARRLGVEFDAVRDSAVRLKALGLDPLDGTLEILIDENARMGGSMERLNGVILAVGQAYTKQKLQAEEALQLTERGVPVWDLLAKATGKNVTELQKLSTQGKLGRDTIRLLLDEIARTSAGSAAKNIGLLSVQFAQLQDRVKQFFTQVAESGALKFFSDQIAELNARFDELAANGELQKFAKRISDSIIGAARAFKAAIETVIAFKNEIILLASAYAAVKTTQAVNQILNYTNALGQALLESKKFRDQGLVGSRKPAETFSDVIGRAGNALRNFTGVAKLAATGFVVDFLVRSIDKLTKATSDFVEAEAAVTFASARLALTQSELARRIQEAKTSYAEFASVGVKSSEELSKASELEALAYANRLRSAIQYYRAIQAEARATGDAAGLNKAREQIGLLEKALVSAKEQAIAARKAITDQIESIGDAAAAAADKFDQLRNAGKNLRDAVNGLFDGIDFGGTDGLLKIADTLKAVEARGTEAGIVIRDELIERLQKLDQVELGRFRAKVEEAMAAGSASAKQFAGVLDLTLQASLERLGVNAAVSANRVTESGRQIIAAFKNVSESTVATSEQIRAAFLRALDSAQTEAEVSKLKAALGTAFDAGKISATEFKVANGFVIQKLGELKRAAIEASGGLASIGSGAKQGAQDAIQALEALRSQAAAKAQDIAQRLAAALSGGPGNVQALRAEYAAADAEVAALNDEIARGTAQIQAQGNAAAASSQQITQAAQTATAAVQESGDATQAAAAQAGGAAAGFRAAIEGILAGFNAQSKAAGDLFKEISAAEFRAFYGVEQFQTKLKRASDEVQNRIDDQKAQAIGLGSLFDELAVAGDAAATRLAAQFGGSSEALLTFADNVRNGRTSIDLLGQADLSNLAAQAERAAQRIKAIEDQAKSARDQLRGLGNSLQDELDRAAGNEEAIARRRYEEQLAQIKALSVAGGAQAQADAERARLLAQKAFDEEIQRIRTRKAEERAASDERIANSQREANATKQVQSQAGGDSVRAGQTAQLGQGIVNITNNFTSIGAIDDATAEKLARPIKKQIDKINNLSR